MADNATKDERNCRTDLYNRPVAAEDTVVIIGLSSRLYMLVEQRLFTARNQRIRKTPDDKVDSKERETASRQRRSKWSARAPDGMSKTAATRDQMVKNRAMSQTLSPLSWK